MKTLEFAAAAVIGATFGSLRERVGRARALIISQSVSHRNVSAIPLLWSRNLAAILILACIVSASAALFPTAGQAQTTPGTVATGAPGIMGTARVSQVLSVDTSGIEDADGNTGAENSNTGFAYIYKWFRVDTDGTSNKTEITGETASAYTLVAADESKKVIVEVRFTDDEGNSEGPLTSDAYPETGMVVVALALPVVTVVADQESAVFRADAVSFTVSRTGSTEADLDVAMAITQTHEYLNSSSLSKTVTIAAGDSDTTLTIPVSQFTAIPRGKPMASGTLTAMVISTTTYDAGVQANADVDIVVALMFSFEEDSYTVDESDGALSFRVVARTGEGAAVPTSSSSVSVSSKANEAESPTDYSVLSEMVSLAPTDFVADGAVYDAETTLTVDIVDDDDDDSGETFTLILDGSPSLLSHHFNFVDTYGNSCGSQCDATVTITDNDSVLAELIVNPTSLDIDEASSGTFTVKLSSLPAADVSVSVSSDDTGAAIVFPTDLTFTASDWSDTQTVTVSGVNDADASNETLTVSLTAISADSGYQGKTASVSLSIDDEKPQVTVQFSEDGNAVNEGGTQPITLTLSADPERDVSIPLTTTEQGGAS